MTNHFHLLIQPIDLSLPALMRSLLTGHAVGFNIRHQRQGHLFQNRYKSIVLDEESYFLELVRYIHLNPVRVDAVASPEALESYPYTGHAVIFNQRSLAGQDVDSVLSRFSRRRYSGRSGYRRFIADGFTQGQRRELGTGLSARVGGENCAERGGRGVLGGDEFAETVVRRQEVERGCRRTAEEVLMEVSQKTGVPAAEILGPGRGRRAGSARVEFFRQALKETGATLSFLGRMAGRTHVAVIKALQKQVT